MTRILTFTGKLPVSDELIVSCEQIHSNCVYAVSDRDRGKRIPNCDGLITNYKDTCLVIRTADCVPISIYDINKNLVGLVHAGWRGTAGEIVKVAVRLMVSRFDSKPGDIKIKIGPAINKNNYLVKEDVATKFLPKYTKFLERVSDDQWKLDLVGINTKQITDLGILRSNIENSRISTFLNKTHPSFRRDGRTKGFVTGIMMK